MKLLGVLGGTGPESTIDYYQLLIAAYRKRRPDGSYPHVVINSVDLNRVVSLVTANDLAGLTAFLLEEMHRLAKAGATIGLLAANTPHIVFDDLNATSPIPLISIVEATCQETVDQGLKRVGLFGTRFTMQAGFYQKVFAREKIDLVVPDAADREYIHTVYMGELVNGIFRPETRERILGIAQGLRHRERIDALILGGTELPLLLRDNQGEMDIPFLDTAQLHVDRAVDEILT